MRIHKHILVTALVLVTVLAFTGCGQYLARNMGGSHTEPLPPNTKLVHITWKKESLWYLTRPMRPDEKAETYTFKESSLAGVVEGTITVVESRR